MTKNDNLQFDKTYSIKTLLAASLFLLSGFASAYVFHLSEDDLAVNSLFPGLFYTSATILLFVLTKTNFTIVGLFIYYAAMYGTYLVAYYLTFITFYFGFLVGILTGGFGAIVTFMLTSRFIRQIEFDKTSVFIAGGLAFVINDIFLIPPLSRLIEPMYVITGWIHTVFAGTFLFWQTIVGTKLFLAIRKAKWSSTAYNIGLGTMSAD